MLEFLDRAISLFQYSKRLHQHKQLQSKKKDHIVPKYVALLRGINVGGNKKVPMAEMKKVLEKIGLKNVVTILASGNAVFESEIESVDKLTADISAALEKKFQFSIPVLLRTFSDIEKMIALDPFRGIKITPQIRLYVTFLSEKPKGKISAYVSPDKSFRIISGTENAAFSVLDLSKANTPEAMSFLEKEFGKNVTTRNWNTVVKIGKL
ncbi:MAG: DUF1697 domain-containing protein [Bacteroidota bacterium]|nr:DUF1697 domain-containing protein [Bacteroidota bacterium]